MTTGLRAVQVLVRSPLWNKSDGGRSQFFQFRSLKVSWATNSKDGLPQVASGTSLNVRTCRRNLNPDRFRRGWIGWHHWITVSRLSGTNSRCSGCGLVIQVGNNYKVCIPCHLFGSHPCRHCRCNTGVEGIRGCFWKCCLGAGQRISAASDYAGCRSAGHAGLAAAG